MILEALKHMLKGKKLFILNFKYFFYETQVFVPLSKNCALGQLTVLKTVVL